MSKIKLFGNSKRSSRPRTASSTSSTATTHTRTPGARTRRSTRPSKWKQGLITFLVLVAIVEAGYLFCVYSQTEFVSKWRNIYIQTAMSTMSHQWLATAFIPYDIISDVMSEQEAALSATIGIESVWGATDSAEDGTTTSIDPVTGGVYVGGNPLSELVSGEDLDETAFYELFWELDRDTMEEYINDNPTVLANGWNSIKINEAGLDDEGTSIYTTMGEQVLAIDAENKILLLRVSGSTYRGVLAVAKDPSRLSVENSKGLGSYGQTAGTIAQNSGGLIAMTGSGFIDNDGTGNGGILAGYAMSNGEGSRTDHMGWSYKRIELREDNRMYIVDAQSTVHQDTTDAVEFTPAIIIDGTTMSSFNGYTALNPRAAIGQSKNEEILMLVIEGRLVNSLGVDVAECAEIFERHNAMQAMNLDGGTSAIMWYDGEYVTLCSNTALPEGRTLPNAFVYG